jgi:2-succinyl-5-enolpyruvyl-6-hydroxy-3-cyclohexene-1-carboxylate synthase
MMKVNRNILWSEIFINRLVKMGAAYACISPGSRNTSLAFAIANNQNLKSYINIDERSSAFFALGLAKAYGKPVILASTSGTAAAELYPAIIEAYQQHIPLIVCTADRSVELLDNGSNQTINQNNIFGNHIVWHFDAGLPEAIPARLKHINAIARRTFYESINHGPVHINFPFRKPFEREAFTDEADEKLVNSLLIDEFVQTSLTKSSSSIDLLQIAEKISDSKGLIVAGPGNYANDFYINCISAAEKFNFPILADASSGFRTCGISSKNILSNYDAFLRSAEFVKRHQPDIILQFGRNITSKGLGDFLETASSPRLLINEWGQWTDPTNNDSYIIKMPPAQFCSELVKLYTSAAGKEWFNSFLEAEETADVLRASFLAQAQFPFEGKVVSEVLDMMPDNSALMISNSMPIRDLDFFAPVLNKNIVIYNNRGASGIDGIISTALGIAAASGKRTTLITGDLAFYYDLNGLLASMKYNIPLTIVLINNNGGGIFEMLPVAKSEKHFKEFFIAPHNLDFSHFVKGYNGAYSIADSWSGLQEQYKQTFGRNDLAVIEIKTDSHNSTQTRREFWKKTTQTIDNAYKNK